MLMEEWLSIAPTISGETLYWNSWVAVVKCRSWLLIRSSVWMR